MANFPAADIGALIGEIADAMNERIQAIGTAVGPIVEAFTEAQEAQNQRLRECFQEKASES